MSAVGTWDAQRVFHRDRELLWQCVLHACRPTFSKRPWSHVRLSSNKTLTTSRHCSEQARWATLPVPQDAYVTLTPICMCVTTSSPILRLCSMGTGLVQFRITIAPFPGSPECKTYTCGEPGIFLMWSWHNQNRTRVLERQHFVHYLTNFVFNARCVWDMCSKLLVTFAHFPILIFGYTHVQLRRCSCEKKIPGSLRTHNFNVRVLEQRSLGTRLGSLYMYSYSTYFDSQDV